MSKSRYKLNYILAMAAALAILIITGRSGDYFFDLNDDVLMKDILSGAYTGVPEGHNIQMLYPISLLISLFYRVFGTVDWYGLFLCGISFACVWLIVFRTAYMVQKIPMKVLFVLAETAVFLGFYLPHMLYVQYTVVCGLLSATAAFYIVTAPNDGKKTLKMPILLIILAYLIRSEMLLLTLPMVMLAILIKWFLTRGRIVDNAGNKCVCGEKKYLFKRYVWLLVAIFFFILLSTVFHKIGYSSGEWREFNRLFDNRTELYDFQYIPDYEENKEFYDSIGLSKAEQQLLVNYNFGLDEEINADTLGEVAAYANSIRTEDEPMSVRFPRALSLYLYRLKQMQEPASYEYPMTDFPWNIGVMVMYVAVLIFALFEEHGKKNFIRTFFLLVVLFACRSSLWMYIILRRRDPIRITHPLYLVELLILLGILIWELGNVSEEKTKIVPVICMAIVSVIGFIAFPMQQRVISQELAKREDMLGNYRALYTYFKERPDDFFFVDVFTSVSYAAVVEGDVATYSEKMFEAVDNDRYNHDLMGGWANKSPISRRKLTDLGYTTMQDALISDNAYFVQNKTGDTQWLKDYYKDKGLEVSVEKITEVAEIFAIYKVNAD